MGNLIRDIFRQNTWANVSLIEFCMNLSDEQLDAKAGGVYDNAKETLLHIIGAERRYISQLSGKQLEPEISERLGFPGFPVLLAAAEENGATFEEIAASTAEDALLRGVYQGRPYTMATTVPLIQVLNHATEHRSQVKVSLTLAGVTPPELDSWSWGEDQGKTRWAE